ncbi:MAG: hypothetical protein K2Q06_16515 [Parvularculaceae bacterium]|nr:hypothetical protein [Parvularculaceae bacterium]
MGYDDAAASLDLAAVRAVIRSDVVLRCAATGAPQRTAARRDFLVTRADDDTLCLTCAIDGGAFTLSVDAAAQHVCEGRLSLGGVLPERRR